MNLGAFLAFALASQTVAVIAQSPAGGSPVPAGIEGTWLTDAKSEITIAPCPDGFCGTISKIVVPEDIYKANKSAIDQLGSNFQDSLNKDPALRSRPIMGLQILTLHQGKSPKIFDGDIYNPQDGNTYSGYVEVLGPDKVKLNGCVLYNIICRGEEWKRVPQAVVAPSTPTPAPAVPAAPATPAAPDNNAFQ